VNYPFKLGYILDGFMTGVRMSFYVGVLLNHTSLDHRECE